MTWWTLRVAQFYRAIARYSNCTDVFFPKKRGWLDYVFLRHHCFSLIQHLDRGVATLAFLPDRSDTFCFGPFLGMWFVRMRHSSHDFATNSCHSVDLAGWQAKIASIEFWIPWRNAHKPYSKEIGEACASAKQMGSHWSIVIEMNTQAYVRSIINDQIARQKTMGASLYVTPAPALSLETPILVLSSIEETAIRTRKIPSATRVNFRCAVPWVPWLAGTRWVSSHWIWKTRRQ